MRYRVERFSKDGLRSENAYFDWGFQAHEYGKSFPVVYIWYTITRLKDNKVVYEGEYQDPECRNSDGYWLNVTHSPVDMGGYWYNAMRPDELARMRAHPPNMRV